MPNLEHNIPKMFSTVGVVQTLQKNPIQAKKELQVSQLQANFYLSISKRHSMKLENEVVGN